MFPARKKENHLLLRSICACQEKAVNPICLGIPTQLITGHLPDLHPEAVISLFDGNSMKMDKSYAINAPKPDSYHQITPVYFFLSSRNLRLLALTGCCVFNSFAFLAAASSALRCLASA